MPRASPYATRQESVHARTISGNPSAKPNTKPAAAVGSSAGEGDDRMHERDADQRERGGPAERVQLLAHLAEVAAERGGHGVADRLDREQHAAERERAVTMLKRIVRRSRCTSQD